MSSKDRTAPTTEKEVKDKEATASGATDTKNTLVTLEDDDEFEDFPVEDWEESATIGASTVPEHLWEQDWDDEDNAEDSFASKLRDELNKTANKSAK